MERDASSLASAAKPRDESGDEAPFEGDQPDRLANYVKGHTGKYRLGPVAVTAA
jgi:hypothetical protein